jgi:hypothetical protein
MDYDGFDDLLNTPGLTIAAGFIRFRSIGGGSWIIRSWLDPATETLPALRLLAP